MNSPTFHVRHIPIYGDVILAPMAGYSDIPYRNVCHSFGSAMQYTEFVAADALLTKKSNSYWNLLDFLPEESPKVMQIFSNDPDVILRAAQKIETWDRGHPDIIDINMGCSTRKVSRRGAGVGMMRKPEMIAGMFRQLTKYLSVPVTGKIRIGWDDQRNYLEVGKILQEEGAALVAIHARTKEQKYGQEADWDVIAKLKQSLTIPVIGNGDIHEPKDIDAMLAYTGCEAVMIGRGAIGNPWVFARKCRQEIPTTELMAMIRYHLQLNVDYFGERRGVMQFRKHFKKYLAGNAGIKPILNQMFQVEKMGEFLALLELVEGEIGK